MRKSILILTITSVLLFAVSTIAQNEVVITPLGKTTNAVSVSSGTSIVVHDANDNLIGTHVDMSSGRQ